MPGGAVFVDEGACLRADRAADALTEPARDDLAQLLDAVPPVPAIDHADELRPVTGFGPQQARDDPGDAGQGGRPAVGRLGRADHGRVLPDDVRRDHRAVEVEDGERIRGRGDRRGTGLPGGGAAALPGVAAGQLRHGRQVDVLEVPLPVDLGDVEAPRMPRRQLRLQGPGCGVVEDHLRLRVRTVEVGELPQRPQPRVDAAQPRGPLPGAARGGQPVDDAATRPCAQLLESDPLFDELGVREAPLRHFCGLAVGIGQRSVEEVLAHGAHHVVERERIARPGHDMEVLRPRLGGGGFAPHRTITVDEGEDDVDDEVDGNDVEHGVRVAGELGEAAVGVGHDERIGDLEAVDPSRPRVPQRGFDDRRADEGDAVAGLGPFLLGDAFGHRLGQRVDIRPAQRFGAGASEVDEAVLDVLLPSGLGGCGDGLRAHPRTLRPGAAEEGTEVLRGPRFGFDALARELRGSVLGAVVDGVGQPAFERHALRDPADVGGGDVDDVRVLAGLEQHPVEVLDPADVRLERLVDGRIERHARGGVDDGAHGLRQRRQRGEIALEDLDSRPQRLGDGVLTGPGDPGGEHGSGQEPLHPVTSRLRPAGTDENGDGVLRSALEQSLEDRLTEESGRTGEKNAARCHLLPIGSCGNGFGV